MMLGDLLVSEQRVTADQVAAALARQRADGGRLGEHLVTQGALTQDQLDRFLHPVPAAPPDLAATDIAARTLLDLLLKLVHTQAISTLPGMAAAIRLPSAVVTELLGIARHQGLMQTAAQPGDPGPVDAGTPGWALTPAGVSRAQEALEHSRYLGPAPVSLDDFSALTHRQKITNVVVTREKIHEATQGLALLEGFMDKLGPALNSGRAILLYGPPGNGKTAIARSLESLFDDVIYVPHAVLIGQQIMRILDPAWHNLSPPVAPGAAVPDSSARAAEADARWVACRRPFLATGTELTLEHLELKFDPTAGTYEAPLQVKALGGCLLIDDFGHQSTPATNLLNRWLGPMEQRVDHLRFQTGERAAVPFEELVILCTNLDPEELMGTAFLRRLPYKIEVPAAGIKLYRRIFDDLCPRHGLCLTDDHFNTVVKKISEGKGLELAAYQPQFIVEQVIAICRFLGQPPHFEVRLIDQAVDNLRVNRK